MSLLKKMTSGTRSLLKKARFVEVCLLRGYADHNPAPTCANKAKSKEKGTSKCKDDHPKPRKAKDIAETFPFYNLIKLSQDCCETDCPDKDIASFDECLYKESDKNKRKYQITWVECPPLTIKPKKICCFAKSVRPPVVRRKPKEKPSTACQPPQQCVSPDDPCPKIKMPRCRPVRDTVRCHTVRVPSDCVKIKPPYPAFSECVRPKLRKKKRTECGCLDEIPVCELNRILIRREQTGNQSMNPCDRKD